MILPYTDDDGLSQQRAWTWEELMRVEPTLRQLRDFAEANTRTPADPDYWLGWSRIKGRFARLVGWYARNPLLRSSTAFNVTYKTLLDAYELAPERNAS